MPLSTRGIQVVWTVICNKLTIPNQFSSQFTTFSPQLKFELCSEFYIGCLTAEALMDQLSLEMARLTAVQKEDLTHYIETFKINASALTGIEGWDRDFMPLLNTLTDKMNQL